MERVHIGFSAVDPELSGKPRIFPGEDPAFEGLPVVQLHGVTHEVDILFGPGGDLESAFFRQSAELRRRLEQHGEPGRQGKFEPGIGPIQPIDHSGPVPHFGQEHQMFPGQSRIVDGETDIERLFVGIPEKEDRVPAPAVAAFVEHPLFAQSGGLHGSQGLPAEGDALQQFGHAVLAQIIAAVAVVTVGHAVLEVGKGHVVAQPFEPDQHLLQGQ